jgi:hypothetical protein
MNKPYADSHYKTSFVEDCEQGYAGLQLHRETRGKAVLAAQVTYWDATGGWVIETFSGNIPVDIAEELVAEAKETIKTR